MTKKIFLFIVEGISDKDALEPILSELFDNNKIYFKIVYNDLTADLYNNKESNIKNRITYVIKDFLNKNHGFKKDYIEKIILLTDLDGCYIDENDIHYSYSDTCFRYEDDGIYTNTVKFAMKRNQIKSRNLNIISTTSTVYSLPIEIYYFSCNLDHVLYNERNLESSLKDEKAIEFADAYENREEEFIDFIVTDSLSIAIDYHDSWLFIQKDNQSLLRHTNLNTFFINNYDYFKTIVKNKIDSYFNISQ